MLTLEAERGTFFVAAFLGAWGVLFVETWMCKQITKVELLLTRSFKLPITEDARDEQPVLYRDAGYCVKHVIEYFKNENENTAYLV